MHPNASSAARLRDCLLALVLATCLLPASGRAGAFIDLGCADGYHGLAVHAAGLLPGAQIVNIDANPLCEPSLRRIHDVIGGHYRISGVSDRPGTLEFRQSAHPYWASAAGDADAYWASINQLKGDTVLVPSRTLDALVAGMALDGPFVLKLDIQGLEAAALKGATATLANTAVVICEMLVADFQALHALLSGYGFDLLDLTNLHRTQAQALGWFDGVYLSRAQEALRPRENWAPEHNAQIVQGQEQRRRQVLAAIDDLLPRLRR
jgi:FkbM family methyltransferase